MIDGESGEIVVSIDLAQTTTPGDSRAEDDLDDVGGTEGIPDISTDDPLRRGIGV